MGIYFNKLIESAVEDTVQTPDDVGNDLEQIEQNIAGPDGIEGHKEEIENSVTDSINPVEEMSMALYESEYNYNQIMKAIGIAELNEMANGRELIMESFDIKGFFGKIKEVILKLFHQIAEIAVKIFDELTLRYKQDAKWLKNNESKVLKGVNNKKFEFKGYDFPDANFRLFKDILMMLQHPTPTDKSVELDSSKLVNLMLAAEKEDRRDENYKEVSVGDARKELIKSMTDDKAGDIEEFKKYLQKMYYGDIDKKTLTDKKWAKWSIDVLKSSEINDLKQDYNNLKSFVNTSIKLLKDAERIAMKKDTKDANTEKIAHYLGSILTMENNVSSIAYSVVLKAAKDRRSQARGIAHALAKLADSVEGDKNTDSNDSGTSLGESAFSNIVFM